VEQDKSSIIVIDSLNGYLNAMPEEHYLTLHLHELLSYLTGAGATTVLTRVKGIGNDLALDEGVGICGKGGQSVPAGVGQPTLLIDGITVGGTAA